MCVVGVTWRWGRRSVTALVGVRLYAAKAALRACAAPEASSETPGRFLRALCLFSDLRLPHKPEEKVIVQRECKKTGIE